MTAVGVVVPAYNEERCIADVVRSIRAVWPGPIVVVDDGSSDGTAARAAEAAAIVLRHPCNLGIGAAVQSGFRYALEAGWDAAVRVDGDGQHDPAYIPRLVEHMKATGADIVVGSRFLGRRGYQSTFVRRVGIAILSVLSALVGTRVTDPTSGFWAVNHRALELLARTQPDDYPETQALVQAVRAGLRVSELPVVMRERQAGRSSIGAAYAGFYMAKVMLAVIVERLRKP